MSGEATEDLDRLRALFEMWARGDFSDGEVFTDDVAWVPADAIEKGEYRGREAAREVWYRFLEAWKEFRIEAEEIVPGSDGRYLVMQVFRGVGKSSGLVSEERTAVVITMRDGRIARMEGFWDRDAALREAGIQRGA